MSNSRTIGNSNLVTTDDIAQASSMHIVNKPVSKSVDRYNFDTRVLINYARLQSTQYITPYSGVMCQHSLHLQGSHCDLSIGSLKQLL